MAPQPHQAAAQAHAAATRIKTLLPQHQRLLQASNPEAAEVAYQLVQRAVARLYEALSELPEQHPTVRATQSALDQISLTFRPDTTPPIPAYAHRLEIIAAAAVTKELATLIKNSKRNDAELRHALAEAAAAELVRADELHLNLTPTPEAGWSKRQQRSLEAQVKAAMSETIANTLQASIAYRDAMPCVVMPALAKANVLTAPGRKRLLDQLNQHTEDNTHILVTKPSDNIDNETPIASTVGLVYRQTRYLKIIEEAYPKDYPKPKATAALRTAISQLEAEAVKYRHPGNQDFCLKAAERARWLLDALNANHHVTIKGRITEVAGNSVTMVTVTRATATAAVAEQARRLLEQEAEMSVAYDDDGNLTARLITAPSQAPAHAE